MPDPRRLIPAVALAAIAAGSAGAQDCTPRLDVATSGGAELRAIYRAPCAPYAAVTVTHGPLVFGEETGRDGGLILHLPALPGGGILTVTLDGSATRADLPMPADPVPDLAAVIWPDAPPPDLPGAREAESGNRAVPRRLGFPGTTPQVDLLPGVPAQLDLPVTPATCGRTITARIVTGTQTRALRVILPACEAPMGAIRIPLAP